MGAISVVKSDLWKSRTNQCPPLTYQRIFSTLFYEIKKMVVYCRVCALRSPLVLSPCCRSRCILTVHFRYNYLMDGPRSCNGSGPKFSGDHELFIHLVSITVGFRTLIHMLHLLPTASMPDVLASYADLVSLHETGMYILILMFCWTLSEQPRLSFEGTMSSHSKFVNALDRCFKATSQDF